MSGEILVLVNQRKKENFMKEREESDVWVKAKQTDIDSIKKWV